MDPCAKLLLPVLVLCGFLALIQPAKILLIPGPHYSHVNLFSSAGSALKDNGHDVYVLTIKKFKPNIQKHGLNPLLHISPGGEENNIYIKMEPYVKKLSKGV